MNATQLRNLIIANLLNQCVPEKVKSIGRLRQRVRKYLEKELTEIDGLVKPIFSGDRN